MMLSGVREEGLKVNQSTASLIDVVFLLLIDFMVTALLIRKEGDISFLLPGAVEQVEMVDSPGEVRIEIQAEGTVIVEGMRFSYDDRTLHNLGAQVAGLKVIAKTQTSPFFVKIRSHQESLNRRIIEVMDACAAAKVDQLTFSKSI